MLGRELGKSFFNKSLDISLLSLALEALSLCSSDNFGKNTVSYLLACLNATINKIVAKNKLGAYGVVAEYLNLTLGLGLNGNLVYKAILDSDSKLTGNLLACLCNDLACERIDNRLCKGRALNSY